MIHTVKLVIEADLEIHHDPRHPEKTPGLQDLLKNLRRSGNAGNGYAVCPTDHSQYTASLMIRGVKCVSHVCPVCQQATLEF